MHARMGLVSVAPADGFAMILDLYTKRSASWLSLLVPAWAPAMSARLAMQALLYALTLSLPHQAPLTSSAGH